MIRRRFVFFLCVLAVLILPFGISLAQNPPASGKQSYQWYNAPRHSAGVAPDPVKNADRAIIQVYAAQTFSWRGYFAVHTWIIFKRSGETAFTRYDVVGWGGGNVVKRNYALPDGLWFGAEPHVLVDLRSTPGKDDGTDVNAVITEIEAAIKSYPYAHEYRSYPGPNSNTFIAHIGREVPELDLDMPANAIGKDYRDVTRPVGLSPSGTGVQANLLGLFGVTVGLEEGVEINFLGLNVGIDFNRPALRLPSIGRLGMDNIASPDPAIKAADGHSGSDNPLAGMVDAPKAELAATKAGH
jgi:hypothetical protein